jgi:hypothetical protein
MTPSIAETIYADFITSSPTTGAAADADSLPTCEVFEDASDTSIFSPTVVKRTGKTGNYRVPVVCTAANGFEAAKSYNVVVSAIVGGVAAKAIVQTFQIRNDIQAELITYGALKPTVPGATLDVTVNGNAGIDWANIDNNNTYRELMGTYMLHVDNAGSTGSCGYTTTVNNVVQPVLTTKDAAIDGIKAQTDQLTFTDGKVNANADVTMDATDLNAIADALLKRDWNSVTGEAAYSALNAFRMLRNVWNTTDGTLSVKKEDGTTDAWTRTLSTDPSAQPITGAT